jgi:hypothetical protein
MRIFEITPNIKPLTLEKARLNSLKQAVERSRQQLERERERQRQQRELERRRKLQQQLR